MSSFFGSFYNGVAGLTSQAQRLEIVSQNVVNQNTIGYKPLDTQFKPFLAEQGYSGNQAIGVRSAERTNISLPGAVNFTNSPTDLAVTGRGWFVVRQDPNDATTQAYTREGNFRFNKDGNLVNSAGMTLMGFPVANGTTATNLQPINVDLATAQVPPIATTNAKTRINLPVDGPLATLPATAADPVGNTQKPSGHHTFEVFDSNGTQQSLTASFYRTGTNEWAFELDALNGQVTAPGATTNDATVSTPVVFTVGSDGKILTPNPAEQAFTIAWDAQTINGQARPANTTTFTYDMSGFQQLANDFLAFSDTVDGNATGNADRIFFNNDGFLTLESNQTGANNTVFQVPLATFRGEQALQDISGTMFKETPASGQPDIGIPGTDGRGKFLASSLEASAADLTKSFTTMIETQKAYGFNSKVVSTVDDMITRAIEMK